MDLLLWTVFSFLLGALPFSVWIGRLNGVDIRQYGDHNPGATNVLRATGSKVWFAIAICCDIGKGLIPTALAYHYFGWMDARIILIGSAAILGHAYSPFLRFNGGKAIATSGGAWWGILMFEAGIIQCVILVGLFAFISSSDWVAVFTGVLWLLYLILAHPDPALIGLCLFNLILLIIKHRAGLTQPPHLRSRSKGTAE